MEATYIRRFTYLISEVETSEKLAQERIITSFHEVLNPSEIQNLEVYQKEDIYFILLDVDASLSNKNIHPQLFDTELKSEPLERIYELEQQTIYTPKQGQLKKKIIKQKRFVWTLLLQADENLIQEYKDIHSIGKAWPEITKNMKTVGVKDMEIYLCGNQAILIMDTESNFNMEETGPKWQKLPREKEWQTYVSKFQRTNPKSSIQEKWQDMKLLTSKN